MKHFIALMIAGIVPIAAQAEVTEQTVECLAKNIYFEARGQSVKGQMAVGFVTINRAKATRYPDTICGVVYQKKQFSWTNSRKKLPLANDKAWMRAKNIARFLLNNPKQYDHTKGALFYHAKTVDPYWADDKIVTAVIESHVFYH